MHVSKSLVGIAFITLVMACSDATSTVAGLGRNGASPIRLASDSLAAFSSSSGLIERPISSVLTVGTTITLKLRAATGGISRRSFGTTAVAWSSTSPAVASVDGSTGDVRALSAGRAYIVAESGSMTDSVEFEVLAPISVSILPSNPSVVVGGTLQLTASPTAATWTSADTAIVRVSQTGLITAIGAGSATVTGTVATGQSAQVSVTVTAPPAAPPPVTPPTTPPGGSIAYVQPTPPQQQVDVTYPAKTGVTRTVGVGGDLQATLNAAQPGDEVVLAAGAVFTGNFVLPVKSGSGWVVVRAATVPVAAGVRMTPQAASSASVAKVITPNADAAIITAPGAARWRLVGFEVAPTLGKGINYGLVVLGRGDETSVASMPSQVTLDRMFVHGTPSDNLKRCVAFNGAVLAVVDSWLSDCHGKGFDAQGIAGWNGPGPFLIENNRIEGSGQAILFGGADPQVTDLSPSDITIRRNYLFKPLSWANGLWSIKATFELKHGRRVLFEGNVLENHWADAQTGFAILFQTLADDNRSWNWTVVEDVLVRNNIIKRSTGGMNVLARVAYNGGPLPSHPSSRIALVNNLFQEVGTDPVRGTSGRIFQLLSDLRDITVLNNTATLTGIAGHGLVLDGAVQQRTIFANNVLPNTDYGILGSDKGEGSNATTYYLQGGTVTGNVLPGRSSWQYPTGNFFPSNSSSIYFSSGFSLLQSNLFYSGLLGRIGVDGVVLASSTAGVAQ